MLYDSRNYYMYYYKVYTARTRERVCYVLYANQKSHADRGMLLR